MGRYDAIINLPHYEPKNHPRMSLETRSAQFAPFAALVGYEDAVKETARQTTKRIEIDDELKNVLNDKLSLIEKEHLNKDKVEFTYFIKDSKKSGGKYVSKKGIVRWIDPVKHIVYLTDKTEIPIEEIIAIKM